MKLDFVMRQFDMLAISFVGVVLAIFVIICGGVMFAILVYYFWLGIVSAASLLSVVALSSIYRRAC